LSAFVITLDLITGPCGTLFSNFYVCALSVLAHYNKSFKRQIFTLLI